MSRAQRNARTGQAIDGGGAVNESKIKEDMAAGGAVTAKDNKSSGVDGKAQAEAHGKSPKKTKDRKPKTEGDSMEGKSGWDKVGQAGADMITEYNSDERKAKRAKKKDEFDI